MRLHRFIGSFDLGGAEARLADPEIKNQIKNVLRLRAGDELILGDGVGLEARARIVRLEQDAVVCEILDRYPNENEPSIGVTLCVAVLKRENFEWVVQKATELGVAEIIPLITERTIKLKLPEERLRKIIREAAEQSGRGRLPDLRAPRKLADAIREAEGENWFLDPSGEAPSGRRPKQVRVWVGPEGGWSEYELDLARVRGFKTFSLGRLVLRAETAAVAGAALLILG